MDKENDTYQKEYAIESGTDTISKQAQEEKEAEKQNNTVSGQIEYYKKLKPYRDFIKATVIKE